MLFKKLALVGFSTFSILPRLTFSSHEVAINDDDIQTDLIDIADADTDADPNEMSTRSRNLEEGGEDDDCDIAASISCIVVRTEEPCSTLQVPLSSCREAEQIRMTYKVKSTDASAITFHPDKTILKNYNKRVSFDDSTGIEPNGYRQKTIIRNIDTCKKKTIVGSIKVEGWKNSPFVQLSNDFDDDVSDNSYCFAWEFYKVRIRIPSLVPLLTLTIQCFFKNDNGDFHVPCTDIERDDFSSTADLTREVLYRFMVNNRSTEPVDVTQLNIFHGNNAVEIVVDNEWVVQPSSFGEREEIFMINLGDYNNRNVETTADIVAAGTKSQMEGAASGDHEFLVPDLFAIDVSVKCFISGTDEELCAEYMSRLNSGDNNCQTEVIYRYEVEHTGLGCRPIHTLQSSINSKEPDPVSTTGWISNVHDFCAADIFTIDQVKFDDLCAYFGTDVTFEIEINSGDEGRTAETFLGFPVENSFGIVDDGFVDGVGQDPLISDSIETQENNFNHEISYVQCYIILNGIYVDCQKYINEIFNAGNSVVAPFSNQCWQNAYFNFSIVHTGDTCQTLNFININIAGVPRVVDARQWTPSQREFCRDDELKIERKENNINVCALVGNNVSIEIENKISTTTLNIRTQKVSCTSGEIPEKLFFEFTGGRCSSGRRETHLLEGTAPVQAPSSNSRKGGRIPRRKLRTLRKKGKGGKGRSSGNSGKETGGNGTGNNVGDGDGNNFGGSNFRPNPCLTSQDHETLCTDFEHNQQWSSHFTPRFENGSGYARNDFALSHEGLIEISPNSFSRDICVNVYDYNQNMEKAYFQSFTFDTACTETLTLGDEFGSFKLVRFVIAGVEYNL